MRATPSGRSGKDPGQPRGGSWRRADRGATAIEYGLIAAFVALSIYAGATIAGNGVGQIFLAMVGQINGAAEK